MKKHPLHLLLPLFAFLILSCASSPEEVREREADKTRKYAEAQEKRRIRAEARDARDEIWWDRIMRVEDL